MVINITRKRAAFGSQSLFREKKQKSNKTVLLQTGFKPLWLKLEALLPLIKISGCSVGGLLFKLRTSRQKRKSKFIFSFAFWCASAAGCLPLFFPLDFWKKQKVNHFWKKQKKQVNHFCESRTYSGPNSTLPCHVKCQIWWKRCEFVKWRGWYYWPSQKK